MADLAQAVTWHRQVAAIVAAADRAGVAEADLPGVRIRLAAQESRLAEAAAGSALPLPPLVPTPSDIAAAGTALGDLTDAAVSRAIRTMLSTLDAVDAALGAPAPVPSGGPPVGTSPAARPVPPPLPMPQSIGPAPDLVQKVSRSQAVRNAGIYGGFAAVVVVAQAVLFVFLDERTSLPLAAPLCLLFLPAMAWLAGFLTIGVIFRPLPGGPPLSRTPRLGAIVCLIPDLLLFAAVVVLFAIDRL